ncbi:hypothetical protein ACIRBX_03455 [Kitasatospora sp. NPDC096147]|uniref:hypothetical protein n=1 Tax=Kitasatospora sp. NPDC096147 TaxID=3364093 RepID=UPI00380999CD
MPHLTISSLAMRSDDRLDLVLDGGPGWQVVHHLGIDRSGSAPVLTGVLPGAPLPPALTELALAAFTARSEPLPAGLTLAWLAHDVLERHADAWHRAQRAAGHTPPPRTTRTPPTDERPSPPHRLTFSSLVVHSDTEADVLAADSAGGLRCWRFTLEREGPFRILHSPEEYGRDYLRVPGPATVQWARTLAAAAIRNRHVLLLAAGRDDPAPADRSSAAESTW